MGPIEQLEFRVSVRSHIWQTGDHYRRIFIERGRLVGALALGPWDQVGRVQDAVLHGATVYPWMLFRFRKEGSLRPERELSPSEMPDSATLCNCTGVTFGQVRRALQSGSDTVEQTGQKTGAGTVCGTCRPLTAELIDAGTEPQALPLWKPVLGWPSGRFRC